jgi:hypothetical protein
MINGNIKFQAMYLQVNKREEEVIMKHEMGDVGK